MSEDNVIVTPVIEQEPPKEIDYKLSLPEGLKLDISPLVSEAKTLGLSQEQAQKMLDHRLKVTQTLQKNQTEAQQKQLQAWSEELKSDKELGGTNLTKTIETRDRGIEKLEKSVPGLKEFLVQNKLLDQPKMVRIFNAIGKMSEDSARIAGKGSATPLSLDQQLVSRYQINKDK